MVERVAWDRGFSLFYLFLLVVTFFTGSFLGGSTAYLFALLILLPILSWGHLFWTVRCLRYSQSFSNDHPVKGETVRFTLVISYESGLPGAAVSLEFTKRLPSGDQPLAPLTLIPLARENRREELPVECRFRGTYTVGLARMVFTDLLGWFSLTLNKESTTFYVYPRIIEKDFSFNFRPWGSTLAFQFLKPYRPGLSLRHLDHKRFSQIGEPILREYESASLEEVLVVMDSRRLKIADTVESEAAIWQEEDTVLEIYIALVRDLLKKEIPLQAWVPGNPYRFRGREVSRFDEFYLHIRTFNFIEGLAPASDLELGFRTGELPRIILFVTHLADGELWPFLETASESGTQIIVLHTGSGEADWGRLLDRGIEVRRLS